MCGIIGYINSIGGKHTIPLVTLDKYFTNALIADQVRGVHSTGMLAVNHAGVPTTYKRAMNAMDFLDLKPVEQIINKNNVILVGHNRWATRGEINSSNAHPFQEDQITLFHNGTLSNSKSLTNKPFEVDSEAIAIALSECNHYKDVLEKLEGSYSLVWYDDVEETIYFARNEERPMYFGEVEDSGALLFASEGNMLKWIAERNSIKLKSIFSTQAGVCYYRKVRGKELQAAFTFTPKVAAPNYYSHGYYKESNWKETSKSTQLVNTPSQLAKTTSFSSDINYLMSLPNFIVKPGTLVQSSGENFMVTSHGSITIRVTGVNYTQFATELAGKKISIKPNAYTDGKLMATFIKTVSDDSPTEYEDLVDIETYSNRLCPI